MQETDPSLFEKYLPARRRDSRKGENGRVLVVGGSSIYHGAPVHAARGAQAAGVDLVYIAVPKVQAVAVRSMSADFIVFPLPDSKLTRGSVNRLLNWLPEVDAAVIGPGLEIAKEEAFKDLAISLISRSASLVIDAGALQPYIAPVIKGRNVVVTPHAGEFRRLFGVQLAASVEERAAVVERKAKEFSITILQKGHGDVISDGATTYLNRTGRAAMTVGGTGDVLAGLTAGLIALKVPLLHAAAMAAYANGEAGNEVWKRVGNRVTAEELAEELRYVLKKYDKQDV
ncbi:MAG: NAD(P)H-hydrate dehydratase [Conexivisphaerales archaeon]